jgi:hypothetical protein
MVFDDNTVVQIKLGDLRRIRDVLARVREQNTINRHLWLQVSGQVQRLEAELRRPMESRPLPTEQVR